MIVSGELSGPIAEAYAEMRSKNPGLEHDEFLTMIVGRGLMAMQDKDKAAAVSRKSTAGARENRRRVSNQVIRNQDAADIHAGAQNPHMALVKNRISRGQ